MAGLPAAATAVSRRIPGPARIRVLRRDLAPTLAPVLARVLDRIPAPALALGLGLDLVLARVPAPILDPVHTPGPALIRLLRRRPRRTGTTRSGMPPPSPPEWR
ncbi:hypothetical protein ABIA68_002329 [Stenotrophomonas rhizophila]